MRQAYNWASRHLSEGVPGVFAHMTATILHTLNMIVQLCCQLIYLLLVCLCSSEINDQLQACLCLYINAQDTVLY